MKVSVSVAPPVQFPKIPYILTADVTYGTRNLGEFTKRISIPFVLEDNRWRIPWNWNMLIPGLTETRSLHTTIFAAKRGAIMGSDKKPLAEDVPGYLISVIPTSTIASHSLLTLCKPPSLPVSLLTSLLYLLS